MIVVVMRRNINDKFEDQQSVMVETYNNVKSVSYGSGFYSIYRNDGHTFRYPYDQVIFVEEVRDV